ncbi:hypothetical protein M501DRAFT_1030539 [Patellaria atrata CBS 101060]|uniref:Uncharacterized protein n=1 Tax=Patellaria atrata CBS 101060 TaxID=1346257 RepID=A0A9P4VNZ4_9PEZI|nr:hypothetical protein M501DRAFT_1030539 [Patellaria atrata CBS 101060]
MAGTKSPGIHALEDPKIKSRILPSIFLPHPPLTPLPTSNPSAFQTNKTAHALAVKQNILAAALHEAETLRTQTPGPDPTRPKEKGLSHDQLHALLTSKGETDPRIKPGHSIPPIPRSYPPPLNTNTTPALPLLLLAKRTFDELEAYDARTKPARVWKKEDVERHFSVEDGVAVREAGLPPEEEEEEEESEPPPPPPPPQAPPRPPAWPSYNTTAAPAGPKSRTSPASPSTHRGPIRSTVSPRDPRPEPHHATSTEKEKGLPLTGVWTDRRGSIGVIRARNKEDGGDIWLDRRGSLGGRERERERDSDASPASPVTPLTAGSGIERRYDRARDPRLAKR